MGCIVIAEAGVNHNGNFEIAKSLVQAAAKSGADYIKFQTFKAEALATKKVEQAEYQKKNTNLIETQYRMLKKLELKDECHLKLIKECKKFQIGFLSSAFDLESMKFLKALDMDYLKIPSGEITNLPYLKAAAKFGKPIILSTGMSCLGDIESALNILLECGCNINNINILHCSTEYPANKNLVNLNFIKTLKETFGVNVGYSDHTKGIEIAIAAVALGARIIEKHLTLDQKMEGPDHMASLEPIEFSQMVQSIKSIEKALGSGVKEVTAVEKDNAKVVRKSLVAIKKISKGDVLTYKNVGCKRPGNGISPMHIEKIIGKVSGKNYILDQLIEMNFLAN